MKKPIKHQNLIGMFISRKPEEIPVVIERYPFGTWMNIYFQSAFAEHPELEQIWKDPMVHGSEKSRLVTEATEYFFIDSFLSWFRHYDSRPEEYKLVSAESLNEAFSDNRFWKLFTRPMEERPVFNKEERKGGIQQYTVSDNAKHLIGLYHDFNASLPAGSTIKKEDDRIIIDTPALRLQCRGICEGYAISLPVDFAWYYLGFRKNAANRVNFEIVIHEKSNLSQPSLVDFCGEMADFLKNFKECFSCKHFFKKYDWEKILIQSRINEDIINRKYAAPGQLMSCQS